MDNILETKEGLVEKSTGRIIGSPIDSQTCELDIPESNFKSTGLFELSFSFDENNCETIVLRTDKSIKETATLIAESITRFGDISKNNLRIFLKKITNDHIVENFIVPVIHFNLYR